ncbi:TetR/AcrR family transcriptional regulator [Leptospira sp. FAT2]|uniref:TetR/AcrR family transcriptional regulator n=1 Tax=Leptospira sanjuanensis TaxID=2879643 RepID=UPI001EE9983D|nr:TetR family transcriptional regulator [Leptospira sanjuanensis]MCG6168572.1 TetR/AcrR family transcriptional regulator [Leptospira sanjuanensis]MCG6193990.1 TetR/AcrR family transcriptional regulator [Leptospira sanjuanensis]
MGQPMEEMKDSIELDPEWPEGQKKIFLAAVEIFAQKGFSAATTVEIAKKAGVAEGLIFKHFKSKKELLLRLAMPIMEGFIAPITLRRLNVIFSQEFSSLEQFLNAVFEERIAFIAKNRNLLRIILQEAFINPDIQGVLERVFKERLSPIIKERLRKFQESGLIADIPLDSAFRLIATNLAGYMMLTEIFYQPKTEDGWDREAEMKRTIEFIAGGLAPKKTEIGVVPKTKIKTKNKQTLPKKSKSNPKKAAQAKKKKKKS